MAIGADIANEMAALREARSADDHFYGAWKGPRVSHTPSHAARYGPLTGLPMASRDGVMKAMDETSRYITTDHEHAVIVDAQGQVTRSHDGDSTGVDVPDRDDERGGQLIHNHPGGRSLSHPDIGGAARNDMAAVHAIGIDPFGQHWRYTLHRPATGWPDESSLASAFHMGEIVMMGTYDKAMTRYLISNASDGDWRRANIRAGLDACLADTREVARAIGATFDVVPYGTVSAVP